MNTVYDPELAHQAQVAYCEERQFPVFAPEDGFCWNCHRNIYRKGELGQGHSVFSAGRGLITSCPYCRRSFCE